MFWKNEHLADYFEISVDRFRNWTSGYHTLSANVTAGRWSTEDFLALIVLRHFHLKKMGGLLEGRVDQLLTACVSADVYGMKIGNYIQLDESRVSFGYWGDSLPETDRLAIDVDASARSIWAYVAKKKNPKGEKATLT